MRTLARLILFACASLTSAALAQTPNYRTTITLANLLSGGAPVASAQVCAQPADSYANAISISAPTWGFLLKTQPLCAIVTNGALPAVGATGALVVPDAAHTNMPAPILYNLTVQLLDSGQPSGQQLTFSSIPNVTGTSYSLDNYTPAVSITSPQANAFGYGVGVPSTCTAPSIWSVAGMTAAYSCVNGTYQLIGSVQLTPRGAWSNSATYNTGDIVSYTDGSSYTSIVASNAGNTPSSSSSQWMVLAQAGPPGPLTAAQASTLIANAGTVPLTYATQGSTLATLGALNLPTPSVSDNAVCLSLSTPFAKAGYLETFSVGVANAATGSQLTALLLTGVNSSFTVAARFQVTATPTSTPLIEAFHSGVDYAPIQTPAGSTLAVCSPTSNAAHFQYGLTGGAGWFVLNADPAVGSSAFWGGNTVATVALSGAVRSFPTALAVPSVTVASAAASYALAFASAGGDVAYDVTLTANTTFTITAPPNDGTLRRLTVIIRPAGFTATLPQSGAAIAWPNGSAPAVPPTGGYTVLTLISTGAPPVIGDTF